MSSWRPQHQTKPAPLKVTYNSGNFVEKACGATVVSAYYTLNSKNSEETYKQWIRTFLESCPAHLVFFTEPKHVEFIRECRQVHLEKTHIVVLDKSEWTASTRFPTEFWEAQLNLDPERNKTNHSAELYKIWYEKTHFVLRAIELNPFNHTDFVWTDAGCVRIDPPPPLTHYPNPSKIPTDRMLLLNIEPFLVSDTDFRNVNRISGTILAAAATTWRTWSETYDSVLESYVKANRFVGKDQNIMATIAITKPTLVSLVKPRVSAVSRWFYLLVHLTK